MMKSVSSRKYAFFAAICYAGFALFTIITGINTYERNGVEVPFAAVAFWALLVGMTVTLLLGNKKAVAIAAGLNFLYEAFFFVRSWSVGDALGVVAAAVLLVVLGLALKGNDRLQDFWFVPAVARLEMYSISWISARYFVYFRSGIVWSVLFSLLEVAALVFMGIWLKKNAEEKIISQ